jgi:hypothetical protein
VRAAWVSLIVSCRMKFLAPSKSHIWILPLCWILTAACWSFPIWKYSQSVYTFGGGFIYHFSYTSLDLSSSAAFLFGFVASALEVAAIALGLSFLKASLWIYAVTPIVPAYELLTFHGGSFEEYFREFGLHASLSFYFTAAVALIAFSLLYAIRRFRQKPAGSVSLGR